MPMLAIFAEEAALALASELAPYAAGEAALAASSVLGAEALMGLGAEALGTSALGGAEAALGAEAMAANAASGGAGAGAANINAAQVAAQQNAAMQMANSGITGIPEVVNAGIQTIPEAMTPAQQAYQAASSANSMQGITPGTAPLPAYPNDFQSVNQIANQVASNAPPSPISFTPPAPPPSGLEAGFDKALKFAEKNPFTAMTGAYMGANALGILNPSGATFNDKPYDGPLSRYRLSPNFQGRTANPADFQYRGYAAGGGIMGAGSYDIPVGYDEGGPVALPLPSRTMRDADVFQTPGSYDPMQQPAADAYNDIIRSRVIDDTASGRLTEGNRGYYQATPNQLTTMAQGRGSFGPGLARDELGARSAAGEFAVPGYGDLGQFAGSGGGGGAKPYDDFSSQAYAKGGSLSDSIESYQKMLGGQQQAAPAASRDVGIYYDQDPDTRYQDALTAAQIRQAKVNQRAYVSPPAAKRPTPLGKLNMPTSAKSKDSGNVEAASGGIMQSSLGGYAAGGNPRLLKGPGDGMSDNIPATINGRQPARLADGEFVIPADVVSHLGNGSTEAGAKHLHAMMNKVRKARTGNPKQGKQINAKKYMPK